MDPQSSVMDVNKYVSDYIKFADAKAGIILTFITLIGAAAGATAPAVLGGARAIHACLFVLSAVVHAFLALSTLMVLWHAVHAISPRTDSAGPCMVSFPDIAKQEPAVYAAQVAAASAAEIVQAYAIHNVTLSRIAKAKYDALSNATYWLRQCLFSSYTVAVLFAVVQAGR